MVPDITSYVSRYHIVKNASNKAYNIEATTTKLFHCNISVSKYVLPDWTAYFSETPNPTPYCDY